MALHRIRALDTDAGNAGMPDEAPAGGPPTPGGGDADNVLNRPRGEKRPASGDPNSPSKRPAL